MKISDVGNPNKYFVTLRAPITSSIDDVVKSLQGGIRKGKIRVGSWLGGTIVQDRHS